jgi:hypothetical protein
VEEESLTGGARLSVRGRGEEGGGAGRERGRLGRVGQAGWATRERKGKRREGKREGGLDWAQQSKEGERKKETSKKLFKFRNLNST